MMHTTLLIAALIMSWDPIPVNESIEGTRIEASENGADFSTLLSVPFPDTSAVLDHPLGVRVRYRALFFSAAGDGPPGRIASALTLDWSEGQPDPGRIVMYSPADSLDALIIKIREPSRWDCEWTLTQEAEAVMCLCFWDLSGDGDVDLSDLTFFGLDYGTSGGQLWDLSDFSSLGAVYNRPGYYEWRR